MRTQVFFYGKITLYRTEQAKEQAAVMGIVMTHAVTIRRTVPHWTAEDPRVAPTPMMASFFKKLI